MGIPRAAAKSGPSGTTMTKSRTLTNWTAATRSSTRPLPAGGVHAGSGLDPASTSVSHPRSSWKVTTRAP